MTESPPETQYRPVENSFDPQEAAAMLTRLAEEVARGECRVTCFDRVREAVEAGSVGGWKRTQWQDKVFIVLCPPVRPVIDAAHA